jgi:pyruvate ferredoxin oxidoreductase gamma subunit
LGTAFFLAGFEVQDAPRYGAERRGAPIFAYVRAARRAIYERGIIQQPDLVVVADDTLVAMPAAGVLTEITSHTCLLLVSFTSPATWQQRLNFPGLILTLPAMADMEDQATLPYVGAACAGAAACLVGLERACLEAAVREEIAPLGSGALRHNLHKADEAYEWLVDHTGTVTEDRTPSAAAYERPAWIELPCETSRSAAPHIHGAATSVQVTTGLWRTMHPLIHYDRCHRCWWVCSTFCPDGAINVTADGTPVIDYTHCKGCLVCVAQCPSHAITALPEHTAARETP